MPFSVSLPVALGAYLLGSIPFGFLLVRAFLKEDIRSKGSGNIGATNVVRSGNKGLGALTFLLDACKGYLAVWLVQFVPLPPTVSRQNLLAIAALFAILGHVYPVWLRFKGGKGVATAFGVFLALAPMAALATLGVFVVVFLLSKYVSLASILAALAFPCFALGLRHQPYGTGFITVMFLSALLIIVKHHQNIGRLLRGTEYRFGKKDKAVTA